MDLEMDKRSFTPLDSKHLTGQGGEGEESFVIL